MHDYDNNTKLDGLELLKSMTHFHEHDDDQEDKKEGGWCILTCTATVLHVLSPLGTMIQLYYDLPLYEFVIYVLTSNQA